jgi:hypothetical protein
MYHITHYFQKKEYNSRKKVGAADLKTSPLITQMLETQGPTIDILWVCVCVCVWGGGADTELKNM